MNTVTQHPAQDSDVLYLTPGQIELIKKRHNGRFVSGEEILRLTFKKVGIK